MNGVKILRICLISVLFGLALQAGAQEHLPPPPHEATEAQKEKIKAHKIAFITDHLNLTPEEAQKFWPIYNQHEEERENEIKDFRERFEMHPDEIPTVSEEEAATFIEERLNHEQRMLDLRKQFHSQLKEALPAKKIMILFHVENEFKKQLIKRLGEFSGKPGRKPR